LDTHEAESKDGRGTRAALFTAHACRVFLLVFNLLQALGKLNYVHDIYPHKLFFQNSSTDFYGEKDNFEKQIVKHMIVAFSVLELHLTTKEHVYGAFVVHLLGINRIRSVMQRLKVNLQRPAVILCSTLLCISVI
jgi:hypothetical protein